MVQEIRPIPTKKYNQSRAKISDGKSIRVTVPAETTIKAHNFYLLDGWFGAAMQSVTTEAGETDYVILNIEEAEYETNQTNESQEYTVGTPLFWNSSTKKITETATGNRYVGTVTEPKDANGVISFKLSAQANPIVKASAIDDIVTDMSADTNDDELKTKLNELLAALRAANVISE
ncbi:hypothetical protein U472_00440 [Orenia metallireducens]|jgi:hypothetical protein|uniref:Uncharacterized protein n=1 Tax=Orenia metallireducens TaxID=1413210 RepID=A0A1C0ADE0_9FIRM|nr:DUF2190 family protein [Orenia metallireducens]OCL28657.1 hypothetical protein U472_00440 [Orenia metallireducens]